MRSFNMGRRLILAIALSFLVMMIWSRLTEKLYPPAIQEVTEITPQPQPPPAFIPPEPKVQEQEPGALVRAVSHERELVFSLPSACLKEIIFYRFGDYDFNLGQGFCLTEPDLVFTQERLDSQEAIFVHQDEKRKITKHFNYSDPNYIITLDIKIENLSDQPLSYPSGLTLGTINLKPKTSSSSHARGLLFTEAFLKQPDKILRLSPRKETKRNLDGEFFGFRDRYFCAILIPISLPETFQITLVNRTISHLGASRPITELLPNQIGHLQYSIYLGPQQAELLKSFQTGAEKIIYYGIFDPISKLLLNILRFFSRILRNWGLAIIALSIFIFFVLFPIFLKQMRSTKDMQRLQPKIEELRRAYKDNPQKLNKEVLELYRENKINPLGGCLPMLGQIPIFFSLYQALMRSIELKGANFLWIKDLSQPDRLIANPEINILPILMAIAMFLQQKVTMVPGVGSAGEQQRIMSFMFPVLFGFIFYRMPSGLVLYWFVNSLLMFGYQMKIKGSR